MNNASHVFVGKQREALRVLLKVTHEPTSQRQALLSVPAHPGQRTQTHSGQPGWPGVPVSENAQAFSPGPRFCRRLGTAAEQRPAEAGSESARFQTPCPAPTPPGCDHREPISATERGRGISCSTAVPLPASSPKQQEANHPGSPPSHLLHSGSSQGTNKRWLVPRENASGLLGGADTTEGHGERGRGIVGRWRAVPAA